jgi:hypothetical protein
MNTVGDVNLITPEQLTFYHFIIALTFISSPVITLAIFIIWLLYTVKSWLYVIGNLSDPKNQFLFYSVTSVNKATQFRSWFCVELVIFAPVIGYWLFASVFGLVFHFYVLPGVILLYILILTCTSSFLYVLFINRIADGNKQSFLIRLTHNWNKPFSSLFIYQIFDQMKLVYVFIKALSWLMVISVIKFFSDVSQDLRVTGMIMLGIVTAHAFLIYQEHRFTETYLSLSRNLPLNRFKLFINFALVFFVMILPEGIWLLTNFNLLESIGVLLLGLGHALLFRSILYWIGLKMKSYIYWVFGLFILLFYIIMYGLLWLLLPLNLLIAFIIFYYTYHRQNEIMKT